MTPPAAKRRSKPWFADVARQPPCATKLKKRARRSRSINRTGCDRGPSAPAARGEAARKARISYVRAAFAIFGVDDGSATPPARFRDCAVRGMGFSSSSARTTPQHCKGLAFAPTGQRTRPFFRISGEGRRRAGPVRLVDACRRADDFGRSPDQSKPDVSGGNYGIITCANGRDSIAKDLTKGATVMTGGGLRRFAGVATRCAAKRRDRLSRRSRIRTRHAAHNRRDDLHGHGHKEQNDAEIFSAHDFLIATTKPGRHRKRAKENRIT